MDDLNKMLEDIGMAFLMVISGLGIILLSFVIMLFYVLKGIFYCFEMIIYYILYIISQRKLSFLKKFKDIKNQLDKLTLY